MKAKFMDSRFSFKFMKAIFENRLHILLACCYNLWKRFSKIANLWMSRRFRQRPGGGPAENRGPRRLPSNCKIWNRFSKIGNLWMSQRFRHRPGGGPAGNRGPRRLWSGHDMMIGVRPLRSKWSPYLWIQGFSSNIYMVHGTWYMVH